MSYSPEYHREYYQKNKAKKRAQAKAWELSNPEKVKEMRKRQQAKRKAEGKDVIVRKRWEASHREYVLWNAAKQRCKKSGIEFLIEVIDVIIPDTCPFLEIPIDRNTRGRMQPNSPSLDRIDNTKGHIPGNVHVISWKANRIKSDASLDELSKFSTNVQKWLGRL